MYTTKEAVKEMTGVTVDQATIATAHMMIEAWIGKSEEEVTDGSDRSVLGRATIFQAVYINGKALDILEQVAMEKMSLGSTVSTFNTDMFAPFMSPWAVLACRRLSWNGSHSVHTGPIFDARRPVLGWEYI